MKIEELFQQAEGQAMDDAKVIAALKSGRIYDQPATGDYKKQVNPHEHEVFNKAARPDKPIRIQDDEKSIWTNVFTRTGSDGEQATFRWEPVARIALALQKLIVKRAVSFLFGNPVTLSAQAESEQEKTVLKAVERVMYDVKDKSFNRKVARNLLSCTEVAEIWYPVEKKTNVYGFESKTKLRCSIFSPLLGDTLFPYFDETGDMVAFSREFTVTDANRKSTNYFETYTDKQHFMWKQGGDKGFEMVEGYPKAITIGKIPVVYGVQDQVEWADVQILIERLEKLLSNFADTNDYHAAPKIFITGELTGFAKKGESGAILQGEENSKAEYLSWDNASESVKLEIETLLRMIYTITQTPDISFDSVKGLGNISGVALKLLFMDAHLKVADHQEVFDEYLQRRVNIIKAYIGQMNKTLEGVAEDMMIEPVITPYILRDEAAEMKIWSDANGGSAVISQRESFRKAKLTQDPDADYEQYIAEQDAATQRQNSFVLGEPTQV